MYNPQDNQAYVISDKDMVQKYIYYQPIAGKFVPNHLGYPTGNIQDAAESFSGTDGKFQSFLNGQIYLNESWLPFGWGDKVNMVFGEIEEYFNHQDNCRILDNGDPACGTGGVFGFPKNDPYLESGKIKQEFEESVLVDSGGSVSAEDQSEDSRRYQNKEFGRRILEKVIIGEISDAEAFAVIMDYIANRINSNDKFVEDVTTVIFGQPTVPKGYIKKKISDNYTKFQCGNNYSNGEVFSDTGFNFMLYNDSRYVQDCWKNSNHTYNSNQLFHSMLGFNVAYYWGKEIANAATLRHDRNPSVFGTDGHSYQDVWLGFEMARLGDGLRQGDIQRGDAGNWVRNHIKNETTSPPRSKEILRQECNKKIEFRKFEKEQLSGIINETDINKLMYTKDIDIINCNGNDVFYQYYNFFNNENPAVAILDETNNRVLLIDDEHLHTEADLSCDLINEFIN